MFGYGFFTELFFVLNNYNIIDDSFKEDFTNAIRLLEKEQDTIVKNAKSLANKIHGTTPIIYTTDGFEGVK